MTVHVRNLKEFCKACLKMAFIFLQKCFHFPIFVGKNSAGHFEIHGSLFSSVNLRSYNKNVT